MSILASTLLSTHKTKSKHDASGPGRGRAAGGTAVGARPIHSVRTAGWGAAPVRVDQAGNGRPRGSRHCPRGGVLDAGSRSVLLMRED